MNKKIYENYLEGLVKDYWDVGNGSAFHKKNTDEWSMRQYELERSSPRDAVETYKSEEFQEALKRWNELKNSPLYKALS